MTRNLRILYVGDLSPEGTSAHRFAALKRLGHTVEGVDTTALSRLGTRIAAAVQLRLSAGPGVIKLNRSLLRRAVAFAPDLVWFDKPLFIWRATLKALRGMGARLVQYNCDNPFGQRNDPGWRLHLATVPDFDLILVPRESGIAAYGKAGGRDVREMPFAYDPKVHFPPPPDWSDAGRTAPVSFIGSPYRGRAEFLLSLVRHHGVDVRVRGAVHMWRRLLSPGEAALLHLKDAVYNDAYREAIWRSRISLAFVTHENLDEVAHRNFEIAACQGFVLAERTSQVQKHFEPGKEVEVFGSPQECAALIRRYLPDEAARRRIAAAARERAEDFGYGNDARLARVIAYLEGVMPPFSADRALANR